MHPSFADFLFILFEHYFPEFEDLVSYLHGLFIRVLQQSVYRMNLPGTNIYPTTVNVQSTQRGFCFPRTNFILCRQQANGRGDRPLSPPRDGQQGGSRGGRLYGCIYLNFNVCLLHDIEI